MTAALSLADQGFPATIMERSSALGGAARDINKTWRGRDVQEFLAGLTDKVEKHPDIEVLLDAEVVGVFRICGQL